MGLFVFKKSKVIQDLKKNSKSARKELGKHALLIAPISSKNQTILWFDPITLTALSINCKVN